MKRLHERLPNSIRDLRKRASREFALGSISKEDFDSIIEHLNDIYKIVMKKEGNVEDAADN